MVECLNAELNEIDPHDLIRVKDKIKDPTDDEIQMFTNPSSIVDKPKDGLAKFTCNICSSIAIDAVQDINCAHSFCR